MNNFRETMINNMIEAMYGVWCDFDDKIECQAVQDAIDSICAYYAANGADEKYIDAQITQAICEHEKAAFMDGFQMCFDLLHRNNDK